MPDNVSAVREHMHLRRYLGLFLAHQGRKGFLALGCLLLSGVLSGVSILALLPLLQFVGVEPDDNGFIGRVQSVMNDLGIGNSLGTALIAFLTVYAAQAVLMRSLNLFNADVERSFTRSLEQRLYAAIMRCEWSFFLRNRNSDLTFSLTQNVQRVATGTIALLRMLTTIVVTFVHFALCFAISPMVSMGILGCSAAFWLIFVKHSASIHERGKELVRLNQKLYGNVTDYLAGMKEARSACSEDQQISAFRATSNAMKDSHLSYARTRENTSLMWKLSSVTALLLVLYVSVEIMRIPMVEIVLLTAIAGRLLPRLQSVQTSLQQVLHMLPAFDSLMDLLHRCEAAQESPASHGQEHPVTGERRPPAILLSAEIRLQNVSVRYHEDQEHLALNSVNLIIPVGSTLAIVGPSGAGKTTLADVLMGLLSPTHGKMLVDGRLLKGPDLRPWRRGIGYVPQETFLLHDTLRHNLRWSNPDATDDELHEALHLAAADDFVAALPAGLDTVLGDRGMRLSGGERQRIALARALVRRPKLLILDEATNSLDGENQQRVQSAIQNLHGEMTIVIIAHRLSTVRDADQIVVLEEGQIVEVGGYQELLTCASGRFRGLVDADTASAA